MTVAELIAILSAYPDETPVAVAGFDGWGLNDAADIEVETVKRCNSKSHVAPAYDSLIADEVSGEPLSVLCITG